MTGEHLILASNFRNDEQTASLDRIDNKKGYTKDNVRFVHKIANKIRNIFNDPVLIYFCNLINNPLRGKIDYKTKNHRRIKVVGDIELSWFNGRKYDAIQTEKEFNITPEYGWQLFINQKYRCAYTGLPLNFGLNVRNSREGTKEHTASIDRRNSKLGYIEGNIQWIHKILNKMKSDLDEEIFLYWCKKIAEFHQDIIFV